MNLEGLGHICSGPKVSCVFCFSGVMETQVPIYRWVARLQNSPLSSSITHNASIGIDHPSLEYMARWIWSIRIGAWPSYRNLETVLVIVTLLAPPFLQEELTALRFVQSMYGSLETSYPLAFFRELRRASGILAFAEMSFRFHLIREVGSNRKVHLLPYVGACLQ